MAFYKKKKEESTNVVKSLADIKKKYTHLVEDLTAPREAFPVIPTGSIILDSILGIRGYPRGRITEISGHEGSSKTTLGIFACIEALKMGLSAVFLDFEHAFDRWYATDCGLDITNPKFTLMVPETFEEGSELATALVKTGEVGLVVCDSVTAMTPKSEREGQGRAIGLLARLLSEFLGSFTKDLKKTNTAAIFVNQLRMKIPQMFSNEKAEEYSTGGNALQFYNSIKLRLKRVMGKEANKKKMAEDPLTHVSEEVIDKILVSATTVKNKLAPPFRKGEYWVKLGKGLDNVESLYDLASSRDLISKKGAWYVLNVPCDKKAPGETKFHGQEETQRFIESRPDVQSLLIKEMELGSHFEMSPQEQLSALHEDDSVIQG